MKSKLTPLTLPEIQQKELNTVIAGTKEECLCICHEWNLRPNAHVINGCKHCSQAQSIQKKLTEYREKKYGKDLNQPCQKYQTQPTELTMEWEERFNKRIKDLMKPEKFMVVYEPKSSKSETTLTYDTTALKVFISSEIQAAIQADREGMIKKLKGMKYGENEKIHGRFLHNESIDEIITLIKDKKV